MPTLLTNSKMNPALAARIEASLGARSGRARLRPSSIAALRLVSIALIAASATFFVWQQRVEQQALQQAKTRLLEALESQAAAVANPESELVQRLEKWLIDQSGAYAGDHIADELKAGGLGDLLERPSIYVRGSIEALGNEARIGPAATESTIDALLLCLIEPPTSDDEQALLKKVQAAYRGETVSLTERVQRLYAALTGLPVLSQSWQQKVREADDIATVERYQELFRLAPIKEAQLASRAQLFIFAFDEPKTSEAPTEVDGATKHPVRVHIVDLERSKLLLRVRRIIDPSWISEGRRARYARGLDACRLAMDVRKAAGTKP